MFVNTVACNSSNVQCSSNRLDISPQNLPARRAGCYLAVVDRGVNNQRCPAKSLLPQKMSLFQINPFCWKIPRSIDPSIKRRKISGILTSILPQLMQWRLTDKCTLNRHWSMSAKKWNTGVCLFFATCTIYTQLLDIHN